MGAQSIKLNEIADVWDVGELVEQAIGASGNCLVLEMQLEFQDGCTLAIDLTLESGHQRDDHHHFEFFLALIGFIDSVSQSLANFVFHRDEKLVFNVDELLRLLYELNICLIN